MVNGQLQSVPYRYHTAGSLETRKLLDGDIVFEVSGGSKTEGVARTVRIIDLMLKTWDNSVICASFCKMDKTNSELTHNICMIVFDGCA